MSNTYTEKQEVYGINPNIITTDFIGFQFNGVHSSELNIVRTSDGSRYDENLVSNFQDKTAQVPGSDETLYWESFYSNRTWNVQIAFDNMSELQFRRMRQTFNAKAVGYLIFDEMPFKAYYVKVQSPPQLKYICFGDTGNTRIYKGEGTIQFISYKPYAYSVHKYLKDYGVLLTEQPSDWSTTYMNYYVFDSELRTFVPNINSGWLEDTYYSSYLRNINEWSSSSGLKSDDEGIYNITPSHSIALYNAGDLETDWVAYFAVAVGVSNLDYVRLSIGGVEVGYMGFDQIHRKYDDDTHFRINSRTNLIEGCIYDSETGGCVLTGSLYNEFLTSGDFFKIPVGESHFDCTNYFCDCLGIDYNYLYF